ncbi:metallophosphoesterase family protein [Protofrankia coriariae]|uniref:Phosphoesterase n=1 Tax=Protofrankia coriariae TaxID=1562887 RepID=A0ABR5F284_9ACTN|nr:YfcE family phosphodiesterase [Protofrankia coriariae]KLL10829.1 phosphodiesterase [Protofrankia coriariae]
MRLVLLADTHVPARARDLPAPVWAAVDDVDIVVHSGDWIDVALVEQLRARAPHLIGCFGNNDGPEIRKLLPEVARADLDGVRTVVVHETGTATNRNQRISLRYPDADLVVFGHSHIPWDATVERPDGGGPVRLLNPGSPTDRRRQPHHTFMTASITNGHLDDVVLHQLPPH